MIDMLGPTGSVTMNDVLVTIGAVLSGLVVWRQKAKDEQIKAMQATIDWLRGENDLMHKKFYEKLESMK